MVPAPKVTCPDAQERATRLGDVGLPVVSEATVAVVSEPVSAAEPTENLPVCRL